jgi:ABC-type Fe3+/spermidine/putrescine transport system ATPase subunit
MNHGRVEQVGPPAEIYERPASTFIARFLGEANLISGDLREVSGGLATIALPGGLALQAVAATQLAVGAPINVFVRPERIALADSEAAPVAGLNRAAGRIRRVSFLGNILRYVVEASGADITVDVQNAGPSRLSPGDPVSLAWAVSDSIALEG